MRSIEDKKHLISQVEHYISRIKSTKDLINNTNDTGMLEFYNYALAVYEKQLNMFYKVYPEVKKYLNLL